MFHSALKDPDCAFSRRQQFLNQCYTMYGSTFESDDKMKFRFVDLDVVEELDLPLVQIRIDWEVMQNIKFRG